MQVFINPKEYETIVNALFHYHMSHADGNDAEILRKVILRIEKCADMQDKKKTACHKGKR